jgi:hypothetical protein
VLVQPERWDTHPRHLVGISRSVHGAGGDEGVYYVTGKGPSYYLNNTCT